MDRFLQLMNEVTTFLNETNQLLNKTEILTIWEKYKTQPNH